MARVKLTDQFIKTAPVGDYYDTTKPNLVCRIWPSGKKNWSYMYSVGRTRRRYTIGPFPAINTPQARDHADRLIGLIASGQDPSATKRHARDKTVMRFGELVEKYYEATSAGRKSWQKEMKMIVRHTHDWEHRRFDGITSDDVVKLQDAVAEKGPVTANRVRAAVSAIFNWARGRKMIAVNPVDGVARALKNETSRKRIYSDAELVRLWAAIGAEPDYFRIPWLLQIGMGVRYGEAFDKLLWEAIDLDKGEWMLGNTKNGSDFCVFLPAAIVRELRAIPRGVSNRVFKQHDGRRSWDQIRVAAEIVDGNPHDLRRTFRSNLSRIGIDFQTAEACVNHTLQGVAAIYDRYDRAAEKRDAVERWWAELMRIVSPKEQAEVVEFPAA